MKTKLSLVEKITVFSIVTSLAFSSPLVFATNIGTDISTNNLTVNGILKIITGATLNAILISDASGNTSWATPAALKTILGLDATSNPTFASVTATLIGDGSGITGLTKTQVGLSNLTNVAQVTSVASGTGLTGGPITGTGTLAIDYSKTLATNTLGSNALFFDTTDSLGGLLFEGGTSNTFQTLLTTAEPTADRTITLPNTTGTLALTSDLTGKANSGANTDISSLTAASISINDNATTNSTSINGGTTTGTVSIGTGPAAKTINIGSLTTTSALLLNSGSGNINIQTSSTGKIILDGFLSLVGPAAGSTFDITACSVSAPVITGTYTRGKIVADCFTTETATVSFTGSGYTTAPYCVVSPVNATARLGAADISTTTSTLKLTMTASTGGSATWNYICLQ